MKLFGDCYRERRVLVTGHTGFKGSWLTHWLSQLGAFLSTVSLAPDTDPNHYQQLQLKTSENLQDIRDANPLREIFEMESPEVVFHLAAQPLVRRSYRDPLSTWSTNVLGTANVLEACRHVASVRAILVVTTDKCYENKEQIWGYRESDVLGGHDPYSASKAAAEMVVLSYRQSFFCSPDKPLLASARTGNVIGGGDWSEDRLIPDAVKAVRDGRSLEVRSPLATRPWQHVLESITGYLLLGQKLIEGRREFAQAWNFGPGAEGNRTVQCVLETLQRTWPELRWHLTKDRQPHESSLLQLDSTKAYRLLGWQPTWQLDQGIAKTADWYRQFLKCGEILTNQQLAEFIGAARNQGRSWANVENGSRDLDE